MGEEQRDNGAKAPGSPDPAQGASADNQSPSKTDANAGYENSPAGKAIRSGQGLLAGAPALPLSVMGEALSGAAANSPNLTLIQGGLSATGGSVETIGGAAAATTTGSGAGGALTFTVVIGTGAVTVVIVGGAALIIRGIFSLDEAMAGMYLHGMHAAAQAQAAGSTDQSGIRASGNGGNGGNPSPSLESKDLREKTQDEIRDLAKTKGLVPHPTKPDKWLDPVTGRERLRLDPGHIDKTTGRPYNDPKAAVPHVHGYESDGKTKIRDPQDQNPHFPTR
jgi:hypothetical protein